MVVDSFWWFQVVMGSFEWFEVVFCFSSYNSESLTTL